MAENQKPTISALALAKRSPDYASTAFTVDDVRQIRPAWDRGEAQYFLEKHEVELAHMMLEVGRQILQKLIEQREKEARSA
jgi:hypothetical protein